MLGGRFGEEFGYRAARILECTVKWLAKVLVLLLSGVLEGSQ